MSEVDEIIEELEQELRKTDAERVREKLEAQQSRIMELGFRVGRLETAVGNLSLMMDQVYRANADLAEDVEKLARKELAREEQVSRIIRKLEG